MLWSPMPDKYTVVSSTTIPLLPEEPEGTKGYALPAGGTLEA
jgi:hypothetical protein